MKAMRGRTVYAYGFAEQDVISPSRAWETSGSQLHAFLRRGLLLGELNNVIQIRIPFFKITALQSLTTCHFFSPLGWVIAVFALEPVECRKTISGTVRSFR